MKLLERNDALNSFGVFSESMGIFKEVSEMETLDVVGGSCGGGCGGGWGPIPSGCGSSGPCLPGQIALPNGSGL